MEAPFLPLMANHRPSRWMAGWLSFPLHPVPLFSFSYPRPKHPHTSREWTALMAQRWEKIPLNGYPWALPALVPWTPIPHCSLPSDKSLRSCRPFPFPPQGPFALQHHLFHVDAVGDAFPVQRPPTPSPRSQTHQGLFQGGISTYWTMFAACALDMACGHQGMRRHLDV